MQKGFVANEAGLLWLRVIGHIRDFCISSGRSSDRCLLSPTPPVGCLMRRSWAWVFVEGMAFSNAYPGVLIPFFSISTAFSNRFNRVSSFLASVIQQQYSLRCV